MAGADGGAGRREPLLLGVTGALIGVGLAVALLLFGGFGEDGAPVGGSALPSSLAARSTAPSPTLVAVATAAPSADVTAAPATAAPPTAAPTAAPRPTPTPNTDPVIVTWEVPKQEDCTASTGGMIHVSWVVKRASGVSISIDGPGIYDSYAGLTGEADLPFGCDASNLDHTYTLTTIGGTGPADTSTKTVRTRAPSVVSFTMGEPDCGPGETFVGIGMSFEVRAATGAELRRDGALYSTYSTKATDDIVQYDCSKDSQVWMLTTTGGYGDPASDSVTVSR